MFQNWILPKDKMQSTIKELLDALGYVVICYKHRGNVVLLQMIFMRFSLNLQL